MSPTKPGTEEKIRLTLGSKYRVRSLASRESTLETIGKFKGVVTVGTVDGLAMDVTEGDGQGLVRVIPTHMVLAIDIVEAVKEVEETADEAHMHYT